MFLFCQGRDHMFKLYIMHSNDTDLSTLSQEHFKLVPSLVDAIIHKTFAECLLCASNYAGHSRGHEDE